MTEEDPFEPFLSAAERERRLGRRYDRYRRGFQLVCLCGMLFGLLLIAISFIMSWK